MSRVLMLAHRLPYPPNKGDKIRAYHVLRHLAQRHEVALACLVDDPADCGHVEALRAQVAEVATARIDGPLRKAGSLRAVLSSRSITVTHFHATSLQQQVDAWIDAAPFDAVYCSSAATAEYLFRSRHAGAALRGARTVMDLIDVDSVKWAQYAERAGPAMGWLYRYEARALAAYERRIVEAFDRVFLVSPAEAALLDAGEARGKVGAFANGVDLEYFAPRASGADGPLLVFTGVMDYPPNVEAVRWFANEVFPAIRAEMPEARFAIVGSRPDAAVRRLDSQAGITVTGFVDDVRDWLARAAVCVAPLRIARGVQNKVLEAMAMARPVVASPQAFEGIEARAGEELLVAEDATAFSRQVLGLLRDPSRATGIGRAARACVERHYRWDANLSVLDEAIP
jgi:sugar transferase (PEP-CTERM/EpsH1 system associated)